MQNAHIIVILLWVKNPPILKYNKRNHIKIKCKLEINSNVEILTFSWLKLEQTLKL